MLGTSNVRLRPHRRTENRQSKSPKIKQNTKINPGMPREIAYYYKNTSCQSLVKIEA